MQRKEIQRGDLFYYDFGKREGSVQSGERPVMVIQADNFTEYFGIGSNKIYELTEKENCPFVIWIGSRRVIKRTAFERFLEKQYSI